jgi:hypothetical protein
MITNLKMKERLVHLPANSVDLSARLDKRLRLLLSAGLSNVGDFVLLSSQKSLAHVKPEDFTDETGYECFVNHIHLTDHITESIEPLALLEQGLAFVKALAAELRGNSETEHFNIILTMEEGECTVRFHKIRASQNWLSCDLDKYEEAIAVLAT